MLIATPYKVPKFLFGMQSIIFRFLPRTAFEEMAFNKEDTIILGNSMKRFDLNRTVHLVRCPTLILFGEKDRANRKSARFLSAHIKGSKWKVVKQSGHVANEENPKELARILDEQYEEKQ